MQTSGQIKFSSGRETNHSPPNENQTGSNMDSVLGFLLDNVQKPKAVLPTKNIQIQREAVADAQKEIVKEDIKSKEQNSEQLDNLIEKSNKNLQTLSTVFPFTLFPTTITIDPDKVTVTFKEFFASNNFQTMLIKEITNVEVQTDLFFGSLKIRDSADRAHEILVKFLKKKDAEKAREIIQGLIVGTKQGVDFSQIEQETLVKKVEELGASALPE